MADGIVAGEAGQTPAGQKRSASVLSPTMISPVSKAGRSDFVESLIEAFQDEGTKLMYKQMVTEALADKLAEMQCTVDNLKVENTMLKAQVNEITARCNTLEYKQDDLEQYGRRHSLRLHTNVPEDADEDTDQLVIGAVEAAGVTLTLDDISRSHRVGKKNTNKPRAIIFRMISYRKRREVYTSRKRLPDDHFLTEDLTARRAHLLYLCRGLKRAGLLRFVWTSDGRILVKEAGDSAHTYHIESESDLRRFEPVPRERMPPPSEMDSSTM